jgi:hypothetical protein
MKCLRPIGVALFVALVAQGCATTKTSRMSAKKKATPPKQNQSYALMEDDVKIDPEILLRGNKTRGLSEY